LLARLSPLKGGGGGGEGGREGEVEEGEEEVKRQDTIPEVVC